MVVIAGYENQVRRCRDEEGRKRRIKRASQLDSDALLYR